MVEFGETYYKNQVYINFERMQNIAGYFVLQLISASGLHITISYIFGFSHREFVQGVKFGFSFVLKIQCVERIFHDLSNEIII